MMRMSEHRAFEISVFSNNQEVRREQFCDENAAHARAKYLRAYFPTGEIRLTSRPSVHPTQALSIVELDFHSDGWTEFSNAPSTSKSSMLEQTRTDVVRKVNHVPAVQWSVPTR